MGRHFFVRMLLLGLILGPASCAGLSQPGPRIDYYTLEYAAPRMGEGHPLPWVIKVERFSAAPFYNANPIVYRDSSFKRSTDEYHRWRSTPADLVTYFLTRDLKESGLFKAVLPRDTMQSANFVLEGSVDEFLEWDLEDAWEAVLATSVTLMAEREPDVSKRVLFQKTYQVKKPCRKRNPRALAEAMSQAMAEFSARLIRDVHNALKR